MSAPILVTKLYVPPAGPRTIPRPRFIARLDEALHGNLTLVSAPAGFDKTTLVGRWVAGCARRVAWLSLDGADSDPARFVAYLLAALRGAAPSLDGEMISALASSRPPLAEAVPTALLNELAALPDPIVLVLDDYHHVNSLPVDDALAFLIDHLRFTADETAAFLNDSMGLALTEGHVGSRSRLFEDRSTAARRRLTEPTVPVTTQTGAWRPPRHAPTASCVTGSCPA